MNANLRCNNLHCLELREISERVLRNEISVLEVIDYFIQRIERMDTTVHAVCVKLFDQAREQASEMDNFISRERQFAQQQKQHEWNESAWIEKMLSAKPLLGIPFTVKESIHVKSTPTTSGLTTLKHVLSDHDSILVTRFKESGAILIGKTNVPQMLCGDFSENPVYGRTCNPFNRERSSGGSSSGEGAVIAYGGSILGIGSDIGGSIRLPSAHCGVYGLKPTSGRLTMHGHFVLYEGMESVQCQMGPMARRVSSLITSMKVLTQYPYDDYSSGFSHEALRIPPVELRDPNLVDISKLRIAVFYDNEILSISKSCERALNETVHALKEMGAHVETISLQHLDLYWEWRNYVKLLMGDGMVEFRSKAQGSQLVDEVKVPYYLSLFPNFVLNFFATLTRWMGQTIMGHSFTTFTEISVPQQRQAVSRRDAFNIKFMKILDEGKFDAVLCPATSIPAHRHADSSFVIPSMAYAHLFNYLGLPAGVCPITRVREGENDSVEFSSVATQNSKDMTFQYCKKTLQNSAGLPIGVQVAARYWREDIVLGIMKHIEQYFENNEDYPLNHDHTTTQ
ncbi:hypothetical protein C9374_000649 [Naegleria lovaniensis]|uniref:Amidase domain-containing protein n=1 Tax=Naegleria lovaniensis TaxID=51637 RepID=A0AA88GWV9_NAELO|nr:uncharacterized protein C9374_000649 [Naegleria lovaniensis]KAG2388485.1 hypothetical protein C9374_000649 [Naegleria lovaniensis]